MRLLVARPLTLLAVLVAMALAAIRSDSSSPIDRLRHELLRLEPELRRDLAEPKWTNVEPRQKYLHVIKAYRRFGDRLDELFPLDRQDHLRALDSLWLWARAQAESKSVVGLYMVFRQMQREIVELGAPVNVKQLANFAETILRDPNASIPRSLDRVANLIVQEKLFVAAFQVAKTNDDGPHTHTADRSDRSLAKGFVVPYKLLS